MAIFERRRLTNPSSVYIRLGSLFPEMHGAAPFWMKPSLFDFFASVFIYPTRVVIFSLSVCPSPAFQGRRAITTNESSFLARVPLRMFESVLEF